MSAHKTDKRTITKAEKARVVDLKNPWLAGLLAFLIPGAGHFYQGRVFKGILYAGCILSTFAFGIKIGEGRPVYTYYYNRVDDKSDQGEALSIAGDLLVQEDYGGVDRMSGQPIRQFSQRLFNYGYLPQMMVGLPALPAIIQNKRYQASLFEPSLEFENGFQALFEGRIVGVDNDGNEKMYLARGNVKLSSTDNDIPVISGEFQGSIRVEDGREEPVTLNLVGPAYLGVPIFADPRRTITALVSNPEILRMDRAELIGTTPRSLINWYGVPLEDATLQVLNYQLGKHWELAVVFTWIAGLLNVLAIWDAFEGPAYGRGDETPEPEEPIPATT